MESTDPEGRIQVPDDVYRRLKDQFVLEERGEVDVKGKGIMRTWYLVGQQKPKNVAPELNSAQEEVGRVESPIR